MINEIFCSLNIKLLRWCKTNRFTVACNCNMCTLCEDKLNYPTHKFHTMPKGIYDRSLPKRNPSIPSRKTLCQVFGSHDYALKWLIDKSILEIPEECEHCGAETVDDMSLLRFDKNAFKTGVLKCVLCQIKKSIYTNTLEF